MPLIAALCLFFLATACSPALVSQSRVAHHATLPAGKGSVVVKFERQVGGLLHVKVLNTSTLPVFIDRDGVTIKSESNVLHRERGFGRSYWVLKPGKERMLSCRFDLDALKRGETVELAFDNLLVAEGQPVPVEPVRFVVGS